jgi:hypothetical protein
MPLEPFDEIFEDGDLTSRVAAVPTPLFGGIGMPQGEYHMREFYCTDPSCDCRLVQVHFIHESCFGRAAKSKGALWRQYGWLKAGGKRQAPIAASLNYCWRRMQQQAYVKIASAAGHWLKLDRVTPDFLGVRMPRQSLFRALLCCLLEDDPGLKEHFREHYQMVKRSVGREDLASRVGLKPKGFS